MDDSKNSWELLEQGEKSFVKKNYLVAVENFEKAAELGETDAMEKLADMYIYGIGIDRDIKKAVNYLEKAADIFYNNEFDFSSGKCIKAYVQAAYFGSKYALDKVAEIYLESLLAEENKYLESDTWEKYQFFAESSEAMEQGSDLDRSENVIYERQGKYGDKYKLSGDQNYFSCMGYAAKLGNAKAMTELAFLYRDGLGIHKNKNKSDRWYNIALSCFEKVADFLLENKLHSGETPPNFLWSLNIRLWMCQLASINLLGDTSEQDGYKAIELFNKVVALNDSDELSADELKKIAEIYRDGKGGVIPEGKKAIELFTRIYESGDNFALNEIAKIYRDGLGGVVPDGNKAIELFTKLYESGDKSALNNIAEIYRDGLGGVILDGNKAVELFTKTSNLRALAEIYLEGIAGIAPDGNKAVELLTQIADSEKNRFYRRTAMEKIASIYRSGKGNAEKNIGVAIEWLEKAGCFFEIAEMYRDGVDVEQDGTKAIHYFMKSGNTDAMKELAKIYKKGLGGVEKNDVLAIEWLEKSCSLIELAEMYRDGVEVKQNGTKAVEYFTKVATLGDTYAMKELASIYRNGLDDVERDIEKSNEWILKIKDLEPYGIF